MRRRPSARLLLLDARQRLLLFKFVLKTPGEAFWATPGGAVEGDESFEQAARRELREETGLLVEAIGEPVASREFVMRLPDGEEVVSDERLFVVRATAGALSREGWSALEREVMFDHRWWTKAELCATRETVWPADLPHILAVAGVW